MDAHDLAPLAGLELHQVGRASIAIPGDAAGRRAAPGIVVSGDTGPPRRRGIVGFDGAAGHRRFWRCGISLGPAPFPLAFNPAALAALILVAASAAQRRR
jgi:hypothetical protein